MKFKIVGVNKDTCFKLDNKLTYKHSSDTSDFVKVYFNTETDACLYFDKYSILSLVSFALNVGILEEKDLE